MRAWGTRWEDRDTEGEVKETGTFARTAAALPGATRSVPEGHSATPSPEKQSELCGSESDTSVPYGKRSLSRSGAANLARPPPIPLLSPEGLPALRAFQQP